ncbi:MAG: hypothetical protein KKB50_01010 [Planctomycetes bacterium]|nr:hypothetical protein [Planctomycetota bacterium]
MSKPRILLAGALDADAEARLEGVATVVRVFTQEEQVLRAAIVDCDALVARTHTPVSRRLLEAGRRLRVVGVAGVGVDRVDVAAAEELGVTVVNTPAAASDAVAEFTVGLMLQLLRPIPQLAREYRAGQFASLREHGHGVELGGLTVGIVGMGRIGSRLGRICAAGFGARVLYNDIVEVGPFAFPAEPVDKATIWEQADIITLHVPLTELTRGMVGGEVLDRLRPTTYLVNSARGAIVDTDALTVALVQGRIAGAGLDVTSPEPLPPTHPLFACERCLLTPHVASRTHTGLRRMFAVVDQVLAHLEQAE